MDDQAAACKAYAVDRKCHLMDKHPEVTFSWNFCRDKTRELVLYDERIIYCRYGSMQC